MSIAELILLITTITGLAVALINTRNNSAAIEKLKAENKDLQGQRANDRKDIIILGENYAGINKDVSVLVVLVNKLYNDYEKDMGHKPDIDWEAFDRLLTVQHKTSPLGPLQIK